MGKVEINTLERRRSTTITVPETQHRWLRDQSYDWGHSQSSIIAAALAVVADSTALQAQVRAVLESARTANETAR